ncbi:MAG: hypothetical protein E7604_12845 [Ruminococcaceae bacterium]|nr:hypothetical protein [Oscillospiraceae bacterium]
MMNHTKRTLTAILALLSVSSAALASCGDASVGSVDTAPTTQAETEAIETEAVDPRLEYANVAPAVEDFGGYGYRMAVLVDNDVVFHQVAYWSEGENGDTLNDAVFKRNLAVEEAYNIKISLLELPDTSTTVRKNIQAADDFSDIVFPSSIGDILSLAQQGCFLDLNLVDELQLSQPWWDQRIQDLAIHGKLFCATGDISIRDELREMAVLYNKTLYNQFDYPDPYELVANNNWTWETMASMIRDVARDLNGDGAMTTADQYGLISENIAGWYLFLASGRDSIGYDGKTYTSDIEDGAIYNIFEDVFEVLCDKKSVIIMDDGTHENDLTTEGIWTEATKIFSENRAMFRTGTFGDTVDLRDMKTDFGVLPIPKIDASQDSYYCMAHNDIMPLVIPTTVPDEHKTALLTEALAFESMFTLTPSFYEVFLDEKILRDEKSKEMIDILFDSKVYSLDYVSGITGLYSTVSNIVQTGKNNLASRTASIQKSAQKKLDKFIEKFEDVE